MNPSRLNTGGSPAMSWSAPFEKITIFPGADALIQ
jgi:hypothetical protein